jgi:pyridoxamine 5'-phosphate oxidase
MTDPTQLADLRLSYQKGQLEREQLHDDPRVQFEAWLNHALGTDLPEPYAFSLATADAHGRPHVRTLLLRGIQPEGLVFYSNYDSEKGQNLAENPWAEMLFYWPLLEQQVRIHGAVQRMAAEQSTAYFHTRPRDSQLGAWASTPQTGVVATRAAFEQRFLDLKQQYGAQQPIPRPDFWGGYVLTPERYEFWQGRPNRMHDRFRYTRTGSGWHIDRLMP